jgi:hypothetical protein
MRMRSLERRVHILLDEARYRKVAREAERRNVSTATVIREAIDAMPVPDERRRRAIDEVLAAPAMPVPQDPANLRRELDGAHDRTS